MTTLEQQNFRLTERLNEAINRTFLFDTRDSCAACAAVSRDEVIVAGRLFENECKQARKRTAKSRNKS